MIIINITSSKNIKNELLFYCYFMTIFIILISNFFVIVYTMSIKYREQILCFWIKQHIIETVTKKVISQ